MPKISLKKCLEELSCHVEFITLNTYNIVPVESGIVDDVISRCVLFVVLNPTTSAPELHLKFCSLLRECEHELDEKEKTFWDAHLHYEEVSHARKKLYQYIIDAVHYTLL